MVCGLAVLEEPIIEHVVVMIQNGPGRTPELPGQLPGQARDDLRVFLFAHLVKNHHATIQRRRNIRMALLRVHERRHHFLARTLQ